MKTIFLITVMALVLKLANQPNIERQQAAQQTTDTLKVDPVCRMKLKAKSSTYQSYTHEKVNYTFCSASCKQKFVAQPAKYIKKPTKLGSTN